MIFFNNLKRLTFYLWGEQRVCWDIWHAIHLKSIWIPFEYLQPLLCFCFYSVWVAYRTLPAYPHTPVNTDIIRVNIRLEIQPALHGMEYTWKVIRFGASNATSAYEFYTAGLTYNPDGKCCITNNNSTSIVRDVWVNKSD